MPAVEQIRVILERTFGMPVAESDAQIVLDRLNELASKEAVEHSVQADAEYCPRCEWKLNSDGSCINGCS